MTTRLTQAEIEKAIGSLDLYHHNCHAASAALVKSGLVKGRVARGTCKGVGGQHSWVVLGDDCYDPKAEVIDLTAWSYDAKRPKVWYARNIVHHRPHGYGPYFHGGRPSHHGGTTVELAVEVSAKAREFLAQLGPLDHRGWSEVASLPVLGWPAREIIEAMLDTPTLSAFVPIDIQGMLTDRNPSDLYLA